MGDDLNARWDADEEAFALSDGSLIRVNNKYGAVFAPLALFDRIRLRSLINAARHKDLGEWNLSTDARAHEYKYPSADQEWTAWPDPARGELVIQVSALRHEWNGEDDTERRARETGAVARLLEPVLQRHGASLHGIDFEYEGDAFEYALLSIGLPTKGHLGRDARALAEEVLALLRATEGGATSISLSAARDLAASGHTATLIGQREDVWLDAKRAPWVVDDTGGKLEFAKDVAAFANSGGGLIVVGAATKGDEEGDRLVSLHPVDLSLFSPVRLRAIARARIHPNIVGLEVGFTKLDERRGYGYVYVPPQEEHLRPFLVNGVVTSGKVRETFVGIPVRSDDATKWIDSATLHSWAVAGRLALASVKAT